ncbi:hypothetical protein C8J57DRAFT_1429656 [Mycena rebaudengoi]|nr:hypothetical protein C8J57DRAFT_1429656 [Mycena rebaudengoi]
MESLRGEHRGSYIWGRSVHNTRIERLWYDITHGFGQKWKNFFVDLEVNHGLNPLIPSHIWLLHHLFLDHINSDAQEWAEAWNSHNIHIRGERECSPRDMFLFSMVQDGPRGIQHLTEPVSDEVEDPNTYGIDWDEADNSQMMDHLLGENPHEWEDNNPFSAAPGTLSHVPCDPPNCPFTPEQVAYLDHRLAAAVDVTSRNMAVRRLVWKEAFVICNELYQ